MFRSNLTIRDIQLLNLLYKNRVPHCLLIIMENPRNSRGKVRHTLYFVAAMAVFLVPLVFIARLFQIESPFLSTQRSSARISKLGDAGRSGPIIDGARIHFTYPARTASQIVADKVITFGASRRKIVFDIASHFEESVPEEVQRFFDAVAAGDWPEIDRLFQLMARRSGQYDNSGPADPTLNHFWPAVLETYGVAEQVHNIPADELLKFGEDVLGQLKPGAVYIGGTDSGRFIPTLLAETSAGERPIVLTQNALADTRYLEYIQFLYGDRLQLPTEEDSKRLFAEFKADALKRLEHDEKFPNEPKQVRHLENLKRTGDDLDVSGPTSVMDMNERLLKLILEKNSGHGFALQESFPFKGTYAEATPLGPIMELRARTASEPLSTAAASTTLDYWRNVAAHTSGTSRSDETLKNYSHMAVAHGNLLAHNGHPHAAEQTYQISLQIFPRNVDTLINYRRFLLDQGRPAAAATLDNTFRTQHPDLQPELTKWLPPIPE